MAGPRFPKYSGLLTSRAAAYALLAVVLVAGLGIAKDYGISWDEKAMYVLGEEAYEFILRGESYPSHPGIRFHGAWFEVLQYAAQELLGLRYARHIFIMRHAMNFVVFWAGLVATYAIGLRAFRGRGWALIAVLMLLLSPRQFGHAFFNGRDIPAMALFCIKMFTLLLLVEKPTVRNAVLHAAASGLVIATRVGLLFMPLYTALFLALRVAADAQSGGVDWKRYARVALAYALAFPLFIVAFWPLLWEDPVRNLREALANMLWAQQAPGGFYFGESVGDLPWHWIPIHVVSKTPLLYVALAAAGVAQLLRAAFVRPGSLLREHRNTLLFFLWFILPIFAVVVLHATLFDEWRHLYFVYPALLLLAVSGLRWLFACASRLRRRSAWARGALSLLVAASFLHTSFWMARNHPLQYVYFSWPSRWIEGKFELDYWGLSFRQGLEWILEHDDGDPISVTVTSSPGWEALNILTREQRRRILMRRQFDTKYILDNFRWNQYRHELPAEAKVHSIRVSGMEVLGIYRNPDWNPEADRAMPRMEDFEVQLRFNPNDASLWEK